MRRVLALLVFLAAAFAAGPAYAEDKPANPAPPGDPGTNVEMPFLIAPLSIDGRLYGYAYISLKVVTSTQRAALEVRDKVAFVQDAFVRDVNARTIGKATDLKTVDTPALIARLLADTRRIIGESKIVGIQIVDMQISPIRPGEAVAAKPEG